jgi:transposase
VALEVYPGATGDPTTVPAQVAKLRDRFGLARVVLVGDRGMLTDTQLETLRQVPGIGWVSALRGPALRALVEQGSLQLSLFDRQNLAEITAPAYPGERLIACFNPLLADERQRKRTALLEATERAYQQIAREVARRRKTPLTAAAIGVKVGRVRDRFKVGKHFALTIADGVFRWARNDDAIRQEAALDGVYVIRTSEPARQLSAADTVRTYKGLAQVERAFRCLKGIDLRVRPIYHRLPPRVRAHFFLCLLAYYLEWHLRAALRPLLFEDEQLPQARATRDPVAPAQPSAAVQRKKAQRTTADGLPLQSFDTLLAALGTRCRITCRMTADPADPAGPRIQQLTELTPLQARAMELLQL